MVEELKRLDFMQQILSGRRDFRGVIILEDEKDLEQEIKLEEIVETNKLELNPYYRLRRKIHSRYNGEKEDPLLLKGADLSNRSFYEFRFVKSDLRDVDFSWSILSKANFYGADLRGANMEHADIRKVKNIDTASNLTEAVFWGTIADSNTRKIISQKIQTEYETRVSNLWGKARPALTRTYDFE